MPETFLNNAQLTGLDKAARRTEILRAKRDRPKARLEVTRAAWSHTGDTLITGYSTPDLNQGGFVISGENITIPETGVYAITGTMNNGSDAYTGSTASLVVRLNGTALVGFSYPLSTSLAVGGSVTLGLVAGINVSFLTRGTRSGGGNITTRSFTARIEQVVRL